MNNIILSGGVSTLEKYMNATEIIVKENSILNSINLGENLDLHIIIEKDACLTFNLFEFANILDSKIMIDLYDNSKFVLNTAFISENKYELCIDVNLFGDNIDTLVNIKGINEKNAFTKILMNGQVAGETKNNTISEYAKIINKSKNSCVLVPNLICNTDKIEANHGVSIGPIDKEILYYIESKGIRRVNAIKLIEEGFILSNMDDSIKNIIKNILIGR